jgi:hypothetical protein
MENPTPLKDNADTRPEWETPELIIEMVASVTELNNSGAGIDGGSGS